MLAVLLGACEGDAASKPAPTNTPAPSATLTPPGLLPISGSPQDWKSTPALEPGGPFPTPRPTAEFEQATFHFDHPDGNLSWDGPYYDFSSRVDGHCSFGDEEFGVPGYIGTSGLGFWGASRILRDEGWHWTGYYHGEWQIWQGGDPLVVYLVNTEEPRYAFEYRWQICY